LSHRSHGFSQMLGVETWLNVFIINSFKNAEGKPEEKNR
jgi:hypothetical protein